MRSKLVALFVFLLVAGFVAGLIGLFSLRFRAGDIYPYYSSLRADPLGTKAYYEALQDCCGLTVERNFRPFGFRKNDSGAAIFFAGIQKRDLNVVSETEASDLQFFLSNGGRLIFTYLPDNKDEEPERNYGEIPKDENGEELKLVSLAEKWQFSVVNIASVPDLPATRSASAPARLPSEISAHTRLRFANLGRQWQTLYKVENHPVVIERKIGRGSILLATISYFLSNEAMVRERRPELLLYILGGKQKAVFDEFHNGVSVDPGVASLLRKYHLEWTIAGLLLVAALFIWRNSMPLVPPARRSASALLSEGKDAASGLTNLLRRNVPAREIMDLCYNEWRKSPQSKNKVEAVGSMIKSARSKPQEQYNAISEMLKKRE